MQLVSDDIDVRSMSVVSRATEQVCAAWQLVGLQIYGTSCQLRNSTIHITLDILNILKNVESS